MLGGGWELSEDSKKCVVKIIFYGISLHLVYYQ